MTAGGRGRSKMRVALISVAMLSLAYVFALVVFAWMASGQNIYPETSTHSWRLSNYRDLRAEYVRFRSTTGAIISGRFFPGRSRAVIVLTHGSNDTQDGMLPWAEFLHRAGFSVFTYDSRGRGLSSGTESFGALEPLDLRSAVGYLTSRRDVDRGRIGVLGVSEGASAAIDAAARDIRIRAVVDDSGFSDVRDTFNLGLWHGFLHPKDPDGPLSFKIIELRTGINLDGIRPVDDIARISPRPILIIQGTADTTVPVSDSQANFAAAKAPKQLWWVKGAAHAQSLFVERSAYQHRVIKFFKHALLA
ncbi:MAG: hypothetical protein NVSMB52_07130 [Chloroflexota bacterium]